MTGDTNEYDFLNIFKWNTLTFGKAENLRESIFSSAWCYKIIYEQKRSFEVGDGPMDFNVTEYKINSLVCH